MAESLFDLFGDHLTRQAVRNVLRQPLTNKENRGKLVREGPVKPNEPKKKTGEPKKTFLVNSGKTLQSTPARQMFSPKVKNEVNIFIDDKDREELEFTKPPRRNDYIDIEYFHIAKHVSPPTPTLKFERFSPKIKRFSSEIIESDHEDFADFSIDSLLEDDLGLPDIY